MFPNAAVSVNAFNVLVRALPFIGIGVQTLFSLSLLKNFLPKNSLRICNTLEDFSQGAIEYFRPFSISLWVFPLLRFQFCLYELFCLWWFILVLPRMRSYQSPIWFRGRNCM